MTEADIYLERGSEGIRYTTGKTAGELCLCAAPGSIARPGICGGLAAAPPSVPQVKPPCDARWPAQTQTQTVRRPLTE